MLQLEARRLMAVLAAFRAGLREVIFLGAARKTVDEYGPDRLADIREAKRLAGASLRASRKLTDPRAAILLLREALLQTHRAATLSGTHGLDAPDDAFADFAEAERARDAMDLAVTRELSHVESRTETELNGLVVGRVTALVIVLVVILYAFTGPWGLHNVALHKPVVVSSIRPPPPTAEGVVDGRTRGTFGLQTNEGHPAFVTVDLERSYRIRRIRIYNRGDGWFDESLPLALEVSGDGTTFREVARRLDHFDVWTTDFDGVEARYVRLLKDNGYIALNEIEVYARD